MLDAESMEDRDCCHRRSEEKVQATKRAFESHGITRTIAKDLDDNGIHLPLHISQIKRKNADAKDGFFFGQEVSMRFPKLIGTTVGISTLRIDNCRIRYHTPIDI